MTLPPTLGRAFILALLVSLSTQLSAQTVTLTDLTSTSGLIIEPCETQSYQVQIDLDFTPAAGDQLELQFTLPAELSATTTASTTNATASWSGSDIILTQLNGSTFVVDFDIQGECDLYTFASQPSGVNIDFDIVGEYIPITGPSILGTPNPLTISTGINYPFLDLQLGNPAHNHNYTQATLFTNFTRTFEYVNNGAAAFSGRLRFTDRPQPTVISLTLISANVNSAPVTYCVVDQGIGASGEAFIEIEVDATTPLAVGQAIFFASVAQVTDCVTGASIDETRTEVFVEYGCNETCNSVPSSSMCASDLDQIQFHETTAIMNPDVPKYQSLRIDQNNSCPTVGSDFRQYDITNTATSPGGWADVLEIQIKNWDVLSLSHFDPALSNLICTDQYGNNLTVNLLHTSTGLGVYHQMPNSFTFEVLPDAVNDNGRFDQNETVTVTYTLFHECPDANQRALMCQNNSVTLNDVILGGRFGRECYWTSNHPNAWHPAAYNYRAHLSSGYYWQPANRFALQQLWQNLSGPMDDLELRNFCINSTSLQLDSYTRGNQPLANPEDMIIKVELEIDAGLDYIPSATGDITLVTNGVPSAGPSQITALNTAPWLTTVTTNASGQDIVCAYFEIPAAFWVTPNPLTFPWSLQPQYGVDHMWHVAFDEFFTDFDICFDLQADCSEFTGPGNQFQPMVNETFSILYNVNDPGCAPHCELPIACANTTINVTCPGCYVPGWNIEDMTMERVNFDLQDTDDNNIPDLGLAATPTAPANEANPSNIMVGDIIKIHMESVFSDGENSPGCNLTVASGLWNPFSEGQLHIFGDLMNQLDFIGASASYTNASGNQTFTIPAAAGQNNATGDWWLSLSNADFDTYTGVPTFFDSYQVLDNMEMDLYFQANTNLVGTAGTYYTIEQLVAFHYAAVTPFGANPAPLTAKVDASTEPCPNLQTMGQIQRDNLFHWCTAFDASMITVGYDEREFATTQNYNGRWGVVNSTVTPCEKVVRLYSAQCVGQETQNIPTSFDLNNQVAMTAFSGEVRSLSQIDQIDVNIPPGFTLDRIEFWMRNSTPGASGTTLSCDPNSIPTQPYSIPIGSAAASQTLILNGTADHYQGGNTIIDCTGPAGVSMYDENKIYDIRLILTMTDCQTMPTGLIDMSAYPCTIHWSNSPLAPLTGLTGPCDATDQSGCPTLGTETQVFTPTGSIGKPDHNITVTASNLSTQDPNYDLTFDLDIDIDNIVNTTTFVSLGVTHFFLYFETNCGMLTIQDLTWEGGAGSPAVVGTDQVTGLPIYGIGDVGLTSIFGGANSASSLFQSLQISADYDCSNCPAGDQITVYFGWDCSDYPTTVSPGNVCFLDNMTIPIPATDADIQNSITGDAVWTQCGTHNISVDISATGSDPVENLAVQFTLPAGLTLDPTNGVCITDQTNSTCLTGLGAGPTYTINLNSTTLPWFTYVFSGNSPTLTFDLQVLVDCNFLSTAIPFTITAESYCGAPLSEMLSYTPPSVTPVGFIDNLALTNFNAGTITTCNGDQTTVTLDVQNNLATPSGTQHTVVVTLPPPFTFVVGGGSSQTFNVLSIAGNGSHPITFDITSPTQEACGTVTLDADLILTESITCNNQTCVQSATTQSISTNLIVEQPELTLSNLTINCSSVSVDVDNFSNVDALNWTVSFYCSVGGIPDPACNGGNPLTSVSLATLLAGNNTTINAILTLCPACTEILAVAQSSDGCECSQGTITAPVSGQGNWHQTTSLAGVRDIANDVVTDAQGNVYVTGTFRGTTTFDDGINPAVQISCVAAGSCMFVAKYDECGQLLWVNNTIDGVAEGRSLAVDENVDRVYVAGYILSANFNELAASPSNPNPPTPNYSASGLSAYVAQFNGSTGDLNFPSGASIRTFTNALEPEFTAIGISPTGELFVGGNVLRNGINKRSLLVKLDPDPVSPLITVVSGRLGQPGPDPECGVRDLQVYTPASGPDQIWVTGAVRRRLKWTGHPVFTQRFASGRTSAYITGFSDDATGLNLINGSQRVAHPLFSSPLPANLRAQGEGIALDNLGNVYFTGSYQGRSNNPFQLNGQGGTPLPGAPTTGGPEFKAYLAGWDRQNNTAFVTHATTGIGPISGNIGAVFGKDVTVDANGLYFTGEFTDGDILLPLHGPLSHSGLNPTDRKLYFAAYDHTGATPLWNNVTIGDGDQSVESMTLDPSGHLFSVGSYQMDLDYFSGNPASGVLNATDQFGTQGTPVYNAYVMRGQTSNGELRIMETTSDNTVQRNPGNNLDQLLDHMEVSLYPNPNTGRFTVHIDATSGENELAALDIYDLNGRQIQQKLITVNTDHVLQLEDLNSGLYMIRITHGNHVSSLRMIKQ